MKARYQCRFYPKDRQQRDLARLRDRDRGYWQDTWTLGKDSETLLVTGEHQKLGVTLGKQTGAEWSGKATAISLQHSINKLGVAYQKFFDSLNENIKYAKVKLPKFKNKTKWQSARFSRPSFAFKRDRYCLAKSGTVKSVRWRGYCHLINRG